MNILHACCVRLDEPVEARSDMKPNALLLLLSTLLTLPAIAAAQTPLDTPQRLIHQASGLCFTADDRGRGRGAGIELTPCDDGVDQQWTINRTGQVMNVMTGECLETGNRRQGGQVGLGNCGPVDQRWQLVGRGGYFALRNNQNGLCLDVSGKPGDRPQMRACDRDAEQTWSWIPAPPPPRPRTMSLVNQGLCLDVQAQPGRNAQNIVRVVSCTGQRDQGWEMNARGELVNALTGECLTAGKKDRSGVRNVNVTQCRGKDEQEWKVLQRGPIFMLENDEHDLCLIGNGRGNEATLGKCKRGQEQASWQWVNVPAPRPVPPPPVVVVPPPPPRHPPHYPAPPAPPVVVVPPPHRPMPPPPPGPQAMHEEFFAKVLDGMRRSSFSKDKLHAFQVGVDRFYLTCSQVARAVDLVTMSGDKVKIVETAASRVLDKENREDVVQAFTFSTDQRKVRDLLR